MLTPEKIKLPGELFSLNIEKITFYIEKTIINIDQMVLSVELIIQNWTTSPLPNPGSLPAELNIADLKIPHGSYPHNPLLAECMFLYGAIERFGTGMLEIFQLTKERGLKLPQIDINEGFRVIIWRPSTDSDHVTDHDKKVINFDKPIHRLVFIIEGEMSRKELMEKLELKHRPTFRENYLNPALKADAIEMTIPNTPKSTNQKYRLTPKGSDLKNRLKNKRK